MTQTDRVRIWWVSIADMHSFVGGLFIKGGDWDSALEKARSIIPEEFHKWGQVKGLSKMVTPAEQEEIEAKFKYDTWYTKETLPDKIEVV